MVDAPTEVSLEGIPEVVPISVLNGFRVEFAKDVNEPPGGCFFVSISSVDVKIDVVDALFRMINVNWLWSDIDVAHPDCRLLRIERHFKAAAQALKPSQL